jgi:hypothetical protein
MAEIVDCYNRIKREHVMFQEVLNNTRIPRLKFDKYFNEAIKQKLIDRSSIFVLITEKGREYAEEHELV